MRLKIDLIIGFCSFCLFFIFIIANKSKVLTLFGKILILLLEPRFPNGINIALSKEAINSVIFFSSLVLSIIFAFIVIIFTRYFPPRIYILSIIFAFIVIIFTRYFLPGIYIQKDNTEFEKPITSWPDNLSMNEPIGTHLWETILSECVKSGSKKFHAKLEPLSNSETSHLLIELYKNGSRVPLMSIPYRNSNSFFLVGKFLSLNSKKTMPCLIWSLLGRNYSLEVTFPNVTSKELIAELKEVKRNGDAKL